MPDKLVLVHTEVPTEFEGHGIGGNLVRAGIEFAREQGLAVVPLFPFATDYIAALPAAGNLPRNICN